MNNRAVFVLIATVLPAVTLAQDSGKFQCTYGDMQRRVEIMHEPGVEVPCSVHYFKDTEAPGEQQVLWSAENDASYCRDKALELISKLEGWGWECGRDANTVTEEELVGDTPTAESEEPLGTAEEEAAEDDQ